MLAGTPAWAHSRLLRTDPADGPTVRQPTTGITLTFNEMVKQRFTTVVVDDAGGAVFSRGGVRVVDDTVYQDVYRLPSGDYRVAWRAISADGHPVQGEFRFTVLLPPSAEPTVRPPAAAAPAVPPEKHDARIWLAGAGALVAVGGVAVGGIALAGRRRRVRAGG